MLRWQKGKKLVKIQKKKKKKNQNLDFIAKMRKFFSSFQKYIVKQVLNLKILKILNISTQGLIIFALSNAYFGGSIQVFDQKLLLL